MSYNNYVDADAAWRAAHDHAGPAVAVIKHANPCGIAVGADVAQAHARAHACDPVSAFGGVIAANRTVTAAMAAQVAPVFTEVVLAPEYEPRGARDPHREEEPASAARPGPGERRAGRAAADQRRPARAAGRPHRRRRRRPDRRGRSRPASRPTRRPSRTSPSPGARCGP